MNRSSDLRLFSKLFSALVTLVLVAGLAMVPAPAAAQGAQKAVNSLNKITKELNTIKAGVTEAMGNLTKLTTGAPEDLSKNFKAYSKNVEGLGKAQVAAQKRAEDFKANREAYFAEWDKKMASITDPAIKEHLAERKTAVRATFESVQPAANTVRETFPTFLTELKDIQQMLSIDLSKSGVASAAPIATKATTNGTVINQNLDVLIGALTKIQAQVAPPK